MRRHAPAMSWIMSAIAGAALARSAAVACRSAPLQCVAPLRLNVDTATGAELALLPGVGPKLAESIIAQRRADGKAQLDRVPGIGSAILARIAPHVEIAPCDGSSD